MYIATAVFSSSVVSKPTNVGAKVGTALGPDVGAKLGTALGEELGSTLGALLGDLLGEELGPALGVAVLGDILGEKLGPALGVAVPVGNSHVPQVRRGRMAGKKTQFSLQLSSPWIPSCMV